MWIPWRLCGRSRARSLQALVFDVILRIQIFSKAMPPAEQPTRCGINVKSSDFCREFLVRRFFTVTPGYGIYHAFPYNALMSNRLAGKKR